MRYFFVIDNGNGCMDGYKCEELEIRNAEITCKKQ